VDRRDVGAWVDRYAAAWRTSGTAGLDALFTDDATYLKEPYAEPVVGRAELAELWEIERDGPGEVFRLEREVVTVDGHMAVVRLHVVYGDPPTQEYRDLWVLRFAPDGRCAAFEEWPTWPGRGYAPGHIP